MAADRKLERDGERERIPQAVEKVLSVSCTSRTDEETRKEAAAYSFLRTTDISRGLLCMPRGEFALTGGSDVFIPRRSVSSREEAGWTGVTELSPFVCPSRDSSLSRSVVRASFVVARNSEAERRETRVLQDRASADRES